MKQLMDLAEQLTAQFKYLPRAALITILFMFAYLFIKENGEQRTLQKLRGLLKNKWMMLFLFYSAYMLTSTVLVRYKKRPVNNILENIWFRAGNASYNNEIIKNVLFFIPYTFLFCQAFKPKRPVKSCLILSAATTAFIEFSQLLFWVGEFQISDLLDNFVGGMLGCGVWYLMHTLSSKHMVSRGKRRMEIKAGQKKRCK